MLNGLINTSPLICAIICSTFTFLLTLIGSGVVFFIRKINNDILDYLTGFSAGIMISAAFFSLLNPAIEASLELNYKPYLICSIGFLLGGLFLFLSDKFIDNRLPKKYKDNKSLIMLIFSITLHNIPEGMAIGVAFGSLYYEQSYALYISAFILALGIGIQNFPEGSAVSLPLRASGYSELKSFLIGGLTAIVEPISSVIGVLLVMKIKLIMPLLLSFAASAMIFVVITELIPDISKKNKSIVGLITLIGFTVMMILDVALG